MAFIYYNVFSVISRVDSRSCNDFWMFVCLLLNAKSGNLANYSLQDQIPAVGKTYSIEHRPSERSPLQCHASPPLGGHLQELPKWPLVPSAPLLLEFSTHRCCVWHFDLNFCQPLLQPLWFPALPLGVLFLHAGFFVCLFFILLLVLQLFQEFYQESCFQLSLSYTHTSLFKGTVSTVSMIPLCASPV